ncbi:hypothetical protein [Neogemmobacter tilapiae]|uniref:hypothetical protein n=1 Tax=Neogemmobacter tilapiae TaxID=875041 RepID=UPI0016775540|nr:hypothetical protein [Gemmobacter tilapiae]
MLQKFLRPYQDFGPDTSDRAASTYGHSSCDETRHFTARSSYLAKAIFTIFIFLGIPHQAYGQTEPDSSYIPTRQCGTPPRGPVVARSPVHLEIRGERKIIKYSETSDATIEARYAIIKGSNCWISYFASISDLSPDRFTTSFAHAIKHDPLTTRDHSGNIGHFVKELMAYFFDNPDWISCESSYDKAMAEKDLAASVLSSSEKIRKETLAAKDFNKCRRSVARSLDRRGFIGSYTVPRFESNNFYDNRFGFIVLDGKLILLK